jgi:Ser/Thr protein kinase RdoA (MazF antagonist)
VTGDFVPSNVLVRKQQIAVIDFGMASHGSVFQDLAQFYQHIDFFRLKPIYRKELISRLQDEFLRGYAADFDKSQPLFHLFRIRSIVNRLSATAVSKWSSLPFYVRLYNRWVWPKQLHELRNICDP